jgi:hypothetical protein
MLEARLRSGARSFAWIAGLSLVHAGLLVSTGEDRGFAAGLGVNHVFAAVGRLGGEADGSLAWTLGAFAVAASLFVSGVALVLARAARRGSGAAFTVGMALYGLDAAIFVPRGDALSVGFHACVLAAMLSGYLALRKLRRLEHRPAADVRAVA